MLPASWSSSRLFEVRLLTDNCGEKMGSPLVLFRPSLTELLVSQSALALLESPCQNPLVLLEVDGICQMPLTRCAEYVSYSQNIK